MVWLAGDLCEGGLHPCSMAAAVPRGRERKVRRCHQRNGGLGKISASAGTSGAWMRVVDGKLHHVEFKGVSASGSGYWIPTDPFLEADAQAGAFTR